MIFKDALRKRNDAYSGTSSLEKDFICVPAGFPCSGKHDGFH